MNKELHHTLKQDVSTRWNSQFLLLQSLASQRDDVKAILTREKQYEKLELLNSMHENLLHDLVRFLHPFHTATVQLSRDHSPDVWPMLH